MRDVRFGDHVVVTHVLARIAFRRPHPRTPSITDGSWHYLGTRRTDRNVYADHAYGPARDPDWHSADERPAAPPEQDDTTWANVYRGPTHGIVVAPAAYVTKGRRVYAYELREWVSAGRLPVVVVALDHPGRPLLVRVDPARLSLAAADQEEKP